MTAESWQAAVDGLAEAVLAVTQHGDPAHDTTDDDGNATAGDLLAVLREFDDEALSGVVQQLQTAASRLSAAASAAAAEWHERRLWRNDGHRAGATALSTIAGISPASARRELRRGRAMREMPCTASAVLGGTLTVDHLDLLARAHRPWRQAMFAEHEGILVDQCRQLRFTEAQRLVEYWAHRVDDTATAAEARLRSDDVHCWASATLGGQVAVDASLDPIGGEMFADELHRLARGEHLKDLRSGGLRTPGQRRAAALVEMARRSASLADGAVRARPVFVVHVGDDTARHLCQLASGVVLHPSELVPYIDEALMETILFDSPHTVVGVSAQRSFTGVLRRAIMARDRFCTHPSGCDEPAHRCDVDHIIPWSRGGPTRQENGRLRCTTHNRDPELWPADIFTSHAPRPSGAPPGDRATSPPDDMTVDDMTAAASTVVAGSADACIADDALLPVADELPPTYRHITAADIASVRHRWRMRHGLGAEGVGLAGTL